MVCTTLYTTRKIHVQYCKHGYQLTNVRSRIASLQHIVQQLPHCTADSLSTFYSCYLCHFVQRLPLPFWTAATFATLHSGYHLLFCTAITLQFCAVPGQPQAFLFQHCTAVPSSLSSCKAATLSNKRYSSSPLPSCTAAILSSHGCALVQQQLPSPPKLCTEATLSYPTLYNTGATLSS